MGLKKFEVCGMKANYFFPVAVVVLMAVYTGTLMNGFVGAIAFLLVVGGFFFWIGDNIPFVNSYLGGAALMPLFGAALMNYFGLIPEYVAENVTTFMKGGYQNLQMASVLVGSALIMNRKTLLKSIVRYMPAIIGSQIVAVLFLAVGGLVTGIGVPEAIFNIGAPCMSGGSNGAHTTLPLTYSALEGTDMMYMAGPFMCYASIGNLIAVFLAAITARVGDQIPGFSGHGKLLISDRAEIVTEEAKPKFTNKPMQLATGILLSCTIMVAGNSMASLVPNIAAPIWTIIIAILIKCTGILPDDVCDCAGYWMNTLLKIGLPMLIAGVGIMALDLTTIGSYFSIRVLIVIILGILGALFGAMFFGRLGGLYPVETGITAGLCCCNIGNSGDIAVLSAADRMQLLPFSSISTRIGGALMIVWISLLYPYFMK